MSGDDDHSHGYGDDPSGAYHADHFPEERRLWLVLAIVGVIVSVAYRQGWLDGLIAALL